MKKRSADNEMSLEAQFEYVEQMLLKNKKSEDSVMRAEKRFIRYELILKPLAASKGFRDLSLEALRRYKQKLFPSKKYHRCILEHAKDACTFESVKLGESTFDPKNPKSPAFDATGQVFVCVRSLAAHLCGRDRCNRHTLHGQGTYVCDISGLVLGEQCSMAANRWVRSDAGQSVADDPRSGTEDEADSDESASSPKKKKPALPLPPPAPPVPIRPSFEQLYYSGTVVAPSTAVISSGRFSKGSVAERMACAIQEGSVSASPWYGTEMVRFAIRSVAPKNRECARLLIGAMLYDAAPKQLFEAKHNSALREAGRDVDAYYETCSSEERIPSRAIVYSLYWSRVEPLYDSTISRVMGCETNYTAAHYFAQAILFVWKICESSPFCCEANLAYGGAAAKKKRSHTTIARIGAAALFELADGLAHRISYDKNTRRVFMPSPSGGVDDPRAKGRQVETVHVEFLPAHRYLKLRLPRAAEVSRFLKLGNIEGTYGGGGAKADKSVIESRGWICRCYRSLLSVEPPLTIDQIMEYRLSEYIKLSDEPADQPGAFVAKSS